MADFLWQSFDYPTDTHLPGMKLGMNLKLGTSRSLRSWKSPDDPSTGDFSFEMSGAGSVEMFIKKGSQKIWRTGKWNGQGWNGVPGYKYNAFLNFSLVSNPDEIYYTYSGNSTSISALDFFGVLQRRLWVESTNRWHNIRSYPENVCDNYGKCGSFGRCNPNYSPPCLCLPGFKNNPSNVCGVLDQGLKICVRKRELLCGKGDGFLKLENMKLHDTSNARVDMSLSIKECEIQCRNNCSCTAYSSAYVDGSGCIAWFGDLNDVRDFPEWGQDLFVRVDAIELENSARHSKGSFTKKKLVLLCVLVAVGFLILISAFCCFFKKAKECGSMQRERTQKQQKNSPSLRANEESSAKFELPFFDLDSMIIATENFSPANKLGTGGFGSVYKGKLSNGRDIAVKRLSRNSGQGVKEFKNEVELIAKLQHRNLVQILGCCVEEEEKMLVYEYMPNKSLDFLLFDRSRSISLHWRTRQDIILGIARGFLYFHQDSRLRIVHRDIKASNILLDADMNPKISDFGMARIFGGDQTQENTNRVVGTYGYMSPEYAMDGLFSIKSDIFSFGVLLLEIISGQKNTGFYHKDPSMNLIKHAWELWKDGKPLELVDPSMGTSFPEQEVRKFIQVGILSVQEDVNDRPTMSSIISRLGNEATMPSPKQPGFVLTSNVKYQNLSVTRTGSGSVNEMSTTVVEGR
ncbi:hypothetical protein Scep_028630 [Stephania cephalantha]|uniref:Receptor-like serine/threonine-protein kinase n=1 Tax=Stephania cephalantha TaxID=152367 RepID=A0AAP0HIB3_9MAGN